MKALRSREDRDLRLAGECIYVGEKWKDSRWCNVGRLACWVANDGLVFSDLERKLRKDNEFRKKVQDSTRTSVCMVEGDLRTSWNVSLRPDNSPDEEEMSFNPSKLLILHALNKHHISIFHIADVSASIKSIERGKQDIRSFDMVQEEEKKLLCARVYILKHNIFRSYSRRETELNWEV